MIAEGHARKAQLEYNGVPAKWDKYRKMGIPKAAGPIRNQVVIDRVDMFYAFHTNRPSSRGTKDAVKRAIKKGIPTIEFDQRTGQQYRHNVEE